MAATMLAPRRMAAPPCPAVPKSLDLADDLRAFFRRLRRSVVNPTAEDTQLFADLNRGIGFGRYSLTLIEHAVNLSAKSPIPQDRFGFADVVRSHIVSRSSPFRVLRSEVLDAEDLTNTPADIAARAFERNPCRATCDAAIAAYEAQKAATQLALDELYAARRNLA